jgi:hypothetical protein
LVAVIPQCLSACYFCCVCCPFVGNCRCAVLTCTCDVKNNSPLRTIKSKVS